MQILKKLNYKIQVFFRIKMTQTPNKNRKYFKSSSKSNKRFKYSPTKQVNELISKLIQSPNSNDFTTNLKH